MSSQPAPPQYRAAAATMAAYPPSQPVHHSWLGAGYLNDKFSLHCQRAQGRPFLRTGVRPEIGQRVELTIFLASSQRENLPFRLSGEVVHAPAFGREDMVVDGQDTDGRHRAAAGALTMMGNGKGTAITNFNSPAWRPSTSTMDCGVHGGSMALAHLVRAMIARERPCLAVSGEMLKSTWENDFTEEKKEAVSKIIVGQLGALHGERVVCEAR